MWETWVLSLGWEDLLEKGMATHSSILAWRIPWSVVHGIAKSRKRLTFTSLQYENTGFPGGSDSKESAYNAGDLGSIPGWGRSPGEGNGNPLQYSCLENSTDRGAWWATVHGVAELDTTERVTLYFSMKT